MGPRIDRRLRLLSIGSASLVAVAAILAVLAASPAPVFVAVAWWGLGWGGGRPAPDRRRRRHRGAVDAAQAVLVTLGNAAMGVGGVVGGVLLDRVGSASFPWACSCSWFRCSRW
ncbi:MFS transporter [Streptoalloteichus tenebrarius]|uniref:MFS transporter n=1 Tax=Streptoalloteichus tenebrarius (strain ATCC 17920 / DSM 40477 / JCM 4838 / CBS 697.72 / NBRC 16177 / NCIMB 11028 / NRRL B-12390 / A12253. 1 / ISP 5477) TaxID=1933 RepID=UPI0020A2E45A|nr:MFS transporter [Streptoalloteichus tenebrarius]BFF03786.1 hypothetical protein GCM10020241_54610 [Streptoalloteichus tenebrarius]